MTIKRLIYIGRITSAFILIMGIIHDIATFTPLIQEGLECISEGSFNLMIYNSLICGTSLIFSGVLLIIFLNKIVKYPIVKLSVLLLSAFVCLSGILAVIFISDSPSAIIIFILGAIIFIVALLLQRKIKTQHV